MFRSFLRTTKRPASGEDLRNKPPFGSGESAADTFEWIFTHNFWNSSESVSGPGSTLSYTAALRQALPVLLDKFKIESILDAPCGDFNWMRKLLEERKVDYIGGDIVLPIIEHLQQTSSSSTKRFVRLDVRRDPLPRADLMICRDCLFHLPTTDIHDFFDNFCTSEIKYLLTTTHRNAQGFANTDIRPGEFRLLDLFSTPFGLPREPLDRIDDSMWPHPEREMVLWSREQVEQRLDARSKKESKE